MTKVLLSIGSNQNNPQSQIQSAFNIIKSSYEQVQLSRVYHTQPVSTIPQKPFVNAAILLETEIPAPVLLKSLLSIEEKAGRQRSLETPNGPRNLDLDIILFGDEVWADSELDIPHPRFRERRFVLEPASEIAADMQDPVTHKSIAQLLQECHDTNWVKTLEVEVAV